MTDMADANYTDYVENPTVILNQQGQVELQELVRPWVPGKEGKQVLMHAYYEGIKAPGRPQWRFAALQPRSLGAMQKPLTLEKVNTKAHVGTPSTNRCGCGAGKLVMQPFFASGCWKCVWGMRRAMNWQILAAGLWARKVDQARMIFEARKRMHSIAQRAQETQGE